MTNPTRVCSVSDCNERHACRGYCRRHYAKLYRNTRPKVLCKVEDCDGNSNIGGAALGYCVSHYNKFKNHGDPEGGYVPTGSTPIERIQYWSKKDNNTGCWIWVGSRNDRGYGRYNHKRRPILAHRYSYLAHKGEIPEGYHVDHLCSVRACVNPDHLEAVTREENILRRDQRARDKDAHLKRERVELPYPMGLSDLVVWLEDRGIDPNSFRASHGFSMLPVEAGAA